MTRKYDIDALLDEVVSLPSLPSTVAHIMRLVSDPQCPLSDVAQAISADPPLAIKTLRLVNTAYYGLRQKVSTIEHAVVLLGIKVVKNLAFTATVFDIMKGSVEAFFRHSVSSGMAMRVLVQAGGAGALAQSPEEAFVCGLLHDIGKVFLGEFMPKECEEVGAMCRAQRLPWYQAEQKVIGVDHAAIGARLALKWKLPDVLVNGVAGHHELRYCRDANQKSVAALLCVADFLVTTCAITNQERPVIVISDDIWTASGLRHESVPSIMERFVADLPAVDELMRVAL